MAPEPNDREGPVEPNDLPTPDYEQALSNLTNADLHGEQIIIDYESIQKAAPRELTLLQRLVSKRPKHDALDDIPQRTVVGE